jgi:hypothetical protein
MKMKRLNIEKYIYTSLLALCVATFFTACETVNTDPPDITNIRLIDPEQADIEISGAGLNAWLVIQGTGLATAREVYFNEYSASFNPALVTDENIVIQIPEATPNIGTDSVLTNTVRVVTAYGEDTYTGFVVYAPPAVIELMSCEFALPGDTMTLMGKYFFGVDSVIFPTDLSAIILDESAEGTSCTVVVPEGAVNSGAIRVITLGGASETGTFRDTTGMICNYDDLNTSEGWGGYIYNSEYAVLVPELSGNVWVSEATNMSGPSWWNQTMVNAIVSGPYPQYTNVKAENVFLKFEMYVKGPWNAGYFQATFVSRNDAGDWVETYRYNYQPWDVEDGPVDIETDNWVTAQIPLNEFSLEGNGAVYLETFDPLAAYDFMGFYFINPSATVIPYILIAIDNVRMVEITDSE